MNVKCIGQLLTCWLEQAPKREVRALCEQLQQCIGDQGNDGLTEVVHDNTPTVDLEGKGTAAEPLTATVNVSSEPGNALTVKPSGLYVQAGGEAGDTLVFEDSSTVIFQGEGTEEEPTNAAVRLSGIPGNAIVEQPDGLSAFGHAVTRGYAPANAPTVTGLQAQAWGQNATAGAGAAVAIGRNSNASGGSSIAIGASTGATAGNALAIGNTAQATALRAQSFGYDSRASSQDAIAIGNVSRAQSESSIAIGNSALTGGSAAGAVAVGGASNASSTGGVALGSNARSAHASSVAIGESSDTSRANEVAFASLGSSTSTSNNPRILAGVADPEVEQDAVNLQTLDARFSQASRNAIDALDPETATLADIVNALKGQIQA